MSKHGSGNQRAKFSREELARVRQRPGQRSRQENSLSPGPHQEISQLCAQLWCVTEQVEESAAGSRLLAAFPVSYLYFIANCLNKGSRYVKAPDGKVGTCLWSVGSGHAVAAVRMLQTWPASPVRSTCIQLVVPWGQG